ncbi:hypothetical protein FHR96_003680 [Halomonas organivorans]|uniref:Uncharacterized protein n=1 Tax=Halomonas organivorans TaxID=257772 RepID=A0A7W5C1T0_9GAMM|nr:hypothetical protein [Halomonas organivorans]
MTCRLAWGVCRYPQPSAAVFCLECMAPIEYGISPAQVAHRRDELQEALLCRRQHAIPVMPRVTRPAQPTQGRLF